MRPVHPVIPPFSHHRWVATTSVIPPLAAYHATPHNHTTPLTRKAPTPRPTRLTRSTRSAGTTRSSTPINPPCPARVAGPAGGTGVAGWAGGAGSTGDAGQAGGPVSRVMPVKPGVTVSFAGPACLDPVHPRRPRDRSRARAGGGDGGVETGDGAGRWGSGSPQPCNRSPRAPTFLPVLSASRCDVGWGKRWKGGGRKTAPPVSPAP